VPNFFSGGTGSVWWNRFAQPATAPIYDAGLDTWWQVSAQPLTNVQMQSQQEQSHAGL